MLDFRRTLANEGARLDANTTRREDDALGTEWLTTEQARILSGIGRTKLLELCYARDIKAAKVGRLLRISRKSLSAYMERHSL